MTHRYKLYNTKYITNIDIKQLFHYKIRCINTQILEGYCYHMYHLFVYLYTTLQTKYTITEF